VVSTAIRFRSIHLFASRHCCSVVFVGIFERFQSHSLFQGGMAGILFKVSASRWEKKFFLSQACMLEASD
jgi:hypothetical protein